MLQKCCIQYTRKFGKLSSGYKAEKGQFSSQSQRKAMPQNVQSTAQLHSSHMLAKKCSKFSKPGFSKMWTVNFQLFKLELEKAEELEIKLPTSWKGREFQKNIYFCFNDYVKTFDCITTNCGKLLKRWEYQTTRSASWEICMQVKKQQLEPDMKQWTGSKLGKEFVKAVYCHPAYITSVQSTLCEMPGWMTQKLESRWPGEITTSDTQIIPP